MNRLAIKARTAAARGAVNALLVLVSVSCIFPLVWMGYSSLKTSTEFNRSITALPEAPRFDNYAIAWTTAHMGRYLMNSAFNAVVSLVAVLAIAFVSAYFLARVRFRGRNLVYGIFMFGMLIPVHALLIPLFIQFNRFGLYDRRGTLLLPYIAFGLPVAIFLIEGYLKTIPREIEESAVIDGCGLARNLAAIVLPIAQPIIVTVGILQFFGKWSEFSFALVLVNSEAYKTVPLGLLNFSTQYTVDYPLKMAALILAVLPVLAIYILNSKRIIDGITAGAVKG